MSPSIAPRPPRHLARSTIAKRATLEDLFGGVMYGLINVHTSSTVVHQPAVRDTAGPSGGGAPGDTGTDRRQRASQHVRARRAGAAGPELSNGRRTRGEMVEALGERLEAGRSTLETAIATLTRSGLHVA